jgi:hypothetical protein
VLTIDAPAAQGAAGFLGAAGPRTLTDVSIDARNEYGSVLVVALDGRPLKSAARLLVQVVSEDRSWGWRTKPVRVEFEKGQGAVDAQEITSLGGPPVLVRNLEGRVTLRRSDAETLAVTALDFNGYARQPLGRGRDGEVRIDLLKDCLYYLIAP